MITVIRRFGVRLLVASLAFVVVFSWAANDPLLARTLTGEAHVIDGDTLVVQGVRLRLEGIDAPETGQTCQDQRTRHVIQCGALASEALKRLIANQPITCQLLRQDRYGRHIARCHVSGRMGGNLPAGQDLSAGMVMNGWAVTYMANSRPDLEMAEQTARARGLGIWATRFERPEDYRRSNRRM
jgi:endonuclease YncB( thermonuclease family)